MSEEKKLTISRSYSAKKQVKQYEPIESFSSRSVEIDFDTPAKEQLEISEVLFKICVNEVENDLAKIKEKIKIENLEKDTAELEKDFNKNINFNSK